MMVARGKNIMVPPFPVLLLKGITNRLIGIGINLLRGLFFVAGNLGRGEIG